MKDNLKVLGDVLHTAKRFGERDAFRDQTRSESFVSITHRVFTLIDALKKNGIKRGDRVALLSRNCLSAVECVLTASAGFILVPLNWRLSTYELNALVKDCSPRAIICDETHRAIADDAVLDGVDIRLKILLDGPDNAGWLSYEDLIKQGARIEFQDEPSPSDPALIIYTSGTTGAPKGVTISHEALLYNMQKSGRLIVGADEQDRALMVMPIFHVGGLCFYLLAGYLAGTTTILRPHFDLNQVVETLREEAITNIHLVPTMIADLEAHPDAKESATSLRRVMYAGSSMPIALLERAMITFSGCDFVQAYGSTEGGVISTLAPAEHKEAATCASSRDLLKSCGRPVTGTEVRVIRDDGSPCGPLEFGEVAVQSAGVMQRYWNQPELSERCFIDGYLRIGDIGYFDTSGYLYLVDRKNDMIVTGGENVFPTEVEQVLYQCPGIVEAAVFGVPDAKWIEKVVVAVTLREDVQLTETEIIAFTRKYLAGYKCPKEVLILPHLPRTGAGKISRKNLRAEYEARLTPSSS